MNAKLPINAESHEEKHMTGRRRFWSIDSVSPGFCTILALSTVAWNASKAVRVMGTIRIVSKDQGPEGPALVQPGGVICMVTFTSSDKVSGVPPQADQQPNSTRCVAVAHEMDNISPGSVFSFYQIGAHDSVFTET